MPQTIPANEITLGSLKQSFGLKTSNNPDFFSEWSTDVAQITSPEKEILDRVKTNFLELMEDPPLLENTVKLVTLAPLLDLAGFYRRPFRIETETSVEIKMEDEGVVIRGRIDILVIKNFIWLVAIESKRSDFAASCAIPQTLFYMLANPDLQQSSFGMITNGSEFVFLKSSPPPYRQYATSRLFSLLNPQNDLYDVLAILKHFGEIKP
ncbi:MAG: type I restriction enzyme HsdR N-terminal domain-containing protein [Cyanobacteriota bacterium]|jgi:hypothetical protein